MDQPDVRSRIRTMIGTGELPCDHPEETWAGGGNGARCVACLRTIDPRDVEFEVVLPGPGVTIRLHRACHAIWLEECRSAQTT